MKNKIISAMLIGMSASMAAPATFAFAAAEDTADTTVVDPAPSVEEPGAVEESAEPEAPETDTLLEEPAETTDTSEVEGEGDALVTPSVYDYATDEAAKLADTPDEFGGMITSVVCIDEAIFGKYAQPLTDYVYGNDVVKTTLYDCEMDVMNKIEELALMESEETVNALKLYMARAFETGFGENAVPAGRDVRRSIVKDNDELFATCTTVYELDDIYVSCGGSERTPAEILAETPQEPGADEEPTVPDENTNIPEGGLAAYVQNMNDFEIVVGNSYTVPEVTFDTQYVQSVSIDVSGINASVVGDYEFKYNIVGADGVTTETVTKICHVVEDAALAELINTMIAKVDEVDLGDLTEKDFQDKWIAASAEAKDKIKGLKTEEEMQAVIDEAAKKYAAIVTEQQLFIAKNGYVNIINAYMSQLTFKTDTQKNMAKEALEETIKNINDAKTVDAAAKALEAGKQKMDSIAAEQEDSIDAMKKKAREDFAAIKAEITDTTTISENVLNALNVRLESCETAKEIESVTASGKIAFENAKKIVAGETEYVGEFLKAMKGASKDSDTTSTIDLIIGLEPTKDIKEAESRVKDACMAITSSKDKFAQHLASKAGQVFEGETKAELYNAYITAMAENPKKDLEEKKAAAAKEIEAALAAIEEDNNDIKVKKYALEEEANELLTEAATPEEVDAVVKTVKEQAEALVKEVEALKALDVKRDEAIAKVNKFVDDQTDDKLKASLRDLADSYIEIINAAKEEKDIAEQYDKFTKDAEAVIKAYNEDVALAKAKADVLKKLASLEAQVDKEYETTEMKDLMTAAKEKVNDAKSGDECSTIYTETKEAYSAAYLKGMRAVFAGKIDELMKDITFSNDTYKQKADEVIAKQKENVNQATNEQTMNNCYSLAKKQIDKLVEMQQNDEKLAKLRTDAVSKLENDYPNPTANGKKILDSYKNKILNASSEEEVNKLVADCVSAMTASGDADKQNETAKLKQAKTSAVSALTNMLVNSVPKTYYNEAKNQLNIYADKINKAATIDEVNELLEEGKNVLKKYGGNPDTAIPNPPDNNNNGGNNNGGNNNGGNNNGGNNNNGGGDDVDNPNHNPGGDIDGDGIPNNKDDDMDGDGIPNDQDNDADGDGVLDEEESHGPWTENGWQNGWPENNASQKGGADVKGSGDVKTGDDNMGIIAMAGAAIMASIGAAVFAVRRFLKK